MQMTEIQNSSERKKLIWAGALGILALILLWWTFFGFGSSSIKPSQRVASRPTPVSGSRPTSSNVQPDTVDNSIDQLRPVNDEDSFPSVPEVRRNIFAYYEPPPVVAASLVPTPTPTPTPPVLLANLSPMNVYARTSEFALEISGDKFTPQLRVLVDNVELPTRYVSPQQVSATVPASVITNPGTRQVMLRSSDSKLYSNTVTLNVAAPPVPNYTYIGIIGTHRYIDTAILQDKSNKEILNVQRGDLLGGRFRVTSISEKELVLIDNNLKIKHTLAFTNQGDRGNPLQRPTPRVESDDDEP
jgi:hypothetical protein